MENLPQESQDKMLPTFSTPSSLKGVDRKIFEAKNGKLLIECEQYEFNELVIRVCALIGCALPSPESAAQLFAWCCDNYMGVTARSFELAFGLNAAGSLPSKINHYGSFDASFIGDVLAQYSEMQRKANQQAQKTVHEDHAAQLLEPPIEQSDFMRIHKTHVEQVKSGNLIPAQLFAPTILDFLLKRGILTDENIPDDLIKQFKAKAKRIIFDEHEISKTKWERIKEQPSNYAKYKKYILIEVKRLVYLWYIEEQIKLEKNDGTAKV
jgi:hypothetical protein